MPIVINGVMTLIDGQKLMGNRGEITLINGVVTLLITGGVLYE